MSKDKDSNLSRRQAIKRIGLLTLSAVSTAVLPSHAARMIMAPPYSSFGAKPPKKRNNSYQSLKYSNYYNSYYSSYYYSSYNYSSYNYSSYNYSSYYYSSYYYSSYRHSSYMSYNSYFNYYSYR